MRKVKSKKQIQRGGAWRHFIRRRTLGQKGKPDFKELRQQYEHVPDEANESGIAGALARQMARGGEAHTQKEGTFGPTSRQTEAHRRRAEVVAFRHQTQGLSVWDRALFLLRKHRQGLSQKRCVLLAKGWKRLEHTVAQTLRKKDTETLQKYDEIIGQPRLARLQQALPVLKRGSYKSVPFSGVAAVELSPDLLKQKATSLCGWATGNRQTLLSPALDKVWTKLHESGASSTALVATVLSPGQF